MRSTIIGWVVLCQGLLWMNASAAQSDIQVVDGLSSNVHFVGYSDDQRHLVKIAFIETSDGVSSTLIRESLSGGLSFVNLPYGSSVPAFHRSGQYVGWLQPDQADPFGVIALHIHDFDTEQTRSWSIAVLGLDTRSIRELTLIDETDPFTVLLKVDINNDPLIIHEVLVAIDLISGEQQRIESDFQPGGDEFGISVMKVEHSANGRLILFSAAMHQVTDNQLTQASALILHDRASGINTVMKESDEFFGIGGFWLTADGSDVFFVEGSQLERRDLASGVSRVHEIAGSVEWLGVSEDGERVVIQSQQRVYADGRNDDDQVRPGDAQIPFVDVQRPQTVIAYDLSTGQTQVMNRYSHHQVVRARPLWLAPDGSSVLMISGSDFTSASAILARHAIDFQYRADAAISGLWFESERPGQGVTVQVVPDASDPVGQVILFWYTTDLDGSPLWLIVQGYLEGNTLTGQAMRFAASGFGPQLIGELPQGEAWGSVTVDFSSCREATMQYAPDSADYPSGTLSLSRLAFQSAIGCL